ncbi:MAG: Crp/Fnr family transcriptional regulator, partial [Chitinophagaceae bacterium]
GVWGEVAMPAHPALPEGDARQIVTYIQSLADSAQSARSLPGSGSLKPNLDKPITDNGVLVISASYTDMGGNGIKPLTGNSSVYLRNNKMNFRTAGELKGYSQFNMGKDRHLLVPKGAGSFKLDSLDLQGINSMKLYMGWRIPPQATYTFEVRLDSPDGMKLGETVFKPKNTMVAPKAGQPLSVSTIYLEAVNDGKMHKLYIVSKKDNLTDPGQIALQGVQFGTQ